MSLLGPDDISISESYIFKEQHFYRVYIREQDGLLKEDADKFKNDLIQGLKLLELVEKSIESNKYYESLVQPHPGYECITITVIKALQNLLEESKK